MVMRNILFPLLFGLLTFGFVSNATAQEIVDDHEISEALNDVFGKIFKNEISFNQSLKYAQVYFDQNSSGYINHVYRLLGKTSGTVTKQQMNAAILVVAREFVIDFKKLPKRYFDNIDRLDSLFAIKTPKDKNDDGFTPKSPGQPCNNVDFETGNFTGWELYKGTRTTGNFTTSAMSTVAAGDQHLIVTAGTDAITGLSRIPPGGGTYAARLGDLTTVNSGNGTAASMRQTFLVDANSTSFVFKYAVVLEEGSHTTNDQAFFKVNLYDKNNNPLPCGSFAQTATDAKTSPLFSTKTTGGKTYYYSNWITAVIPLSPYIGENITIEFIATDCQPRGHLGYAYIDASCSPLEVTTTKHFICEGQETATLTAPPGAKSYLWSPGNQTSQTITVSQAGNYTVKVTPDVLTGAAACAVDLPIFVDGSKVTADFTADPLVLCAKESIDVTESSSITCFTPGNDNIVDWKWDFNGDNTTDFTGQNPPSPAYTFNTQGTYNAKLTVTTTRNCVSTKVVPIVVNPLPTATISGTTDVCQNGVAPNITFTGANGTAPYTFTYTINGGSNQTVTSTGNIATVSVPTGTDGTFTYTLVSVQDASSTTCSNPQTGTATVKVNPLPTAIISGTTDVCQNGAAPNITFTGANGTAPYTFTYTINGGSNQTVISTGNTATVSVPTGTAGTFTYTLVSVRDASSTTCSNPQTGTATVKVNPLPTAIISGTTDVCQNGAAPNIIFTGANGIAPYTFTYTINGGSNQTVTSTGNTATVSVPTGTDGTFTYTLVSVQDASSTTCSNPQSGTATVVVNPLPTATISGTTDVCQNGVSPNITFTGANGTAPYTFTYTINGGSNQTVISTGNTATVSVPTGTNGTFTYTLVSVQDASSTTCSNPQSGTATVVVNPLPTATISGTTDVCQNGVSPNITFTGANGTAPYTFTYTINGGSNQTVISTGNTATVSVPTGTDGTFTYTLVSVQDASSTTCSNPQTGTATVKVNPLPTAIISGTTDVCQNGAAPNITFTGANGTAPYTFTYTINGGSNQTVTSTGNTATVSVPTGTDGTFTYTLVSVRDASSTTCSNPQSGTATVVVNPLPTATISGTTDVCQNGVSPNITFTGANGTAPYTFTYTINGGSNQTVTSAGNTATVSVPTGTNGTFMYTLVSVQDASSTTCSNPQSGTATVVVNPLPTATISGTTDVCQNGVSPNITFTGANGTAPYTFTYTINGGSNQTVISTGNTATVSVPTGTNGTFTYTLVSVQDASSTTCSNPQSGTATVVVNPLPTATISGTTDVCRDNTSPDITFTGANGTAPYTFTYTINGGSNQTIISTGNTATISVPTGTDGTFTYTLVSVRDASSTTCFNPQSGTATVVVNPLPTATVTSSNIVHNCLVGGTTGSATISASGGTPSYLYSLDGGVTNQPSDIFSNLASGTYTVTISDINNCTAITTFTINDPANNEELDVVAVPGNLTHNCFVNGTDGSATLTATGGYAPYTYQVTGPNSYNTTQVANPTFTNLLSGTYNVTVSDTNGCSATTTFQINDPANNEELAVIALPGNLIHNCFVNGIDGSATLTATGGYAPYTYHVTGPNSYNTTQVANPTFTNLLSGTYNVTVSDTNDCSATTTFQINDPANNEELAVVALPGNLTHNCFVNGTDGSATLTATGGYAPYTYQITGPNSYNTTQVANPTFTNLLSGTYNVTVSDTNGCSATTTFQINDPANNEELDVVALPGNLTHNCFVNGTDGSATLTATGGYAPYTYQVTGPNSYNTTQVANPIFTNLISGTYNVTVSDTNGCSATTTFQINDPANNEELDVVAFPGNLTHNCFVNGTDGSATLTATGGYAPYTHHVTGPNSYNTTQISNPTFTNLLSGTYNVTVSDTNGCSATTTFQIDDPAGGTVLSASTPSDSLTHNCMVGASDGIANVAAIGGYAPYEYSINGGTTYQSSHTFTGLASGNYTITVRDTNNCTTTTSFTIVDPANNVPLNASVPSDSLTHNCTIGASDGIANVAAIGGYAPYEYSINGGTTYQPSHTFTGLASGNYTITVRDTNNCTTTTNFTIVDPANNSSLIATVPSDSLTHNCFIGGADGIANVAATGGYAPYEYSINGGTTYQPSHTFTGLASGNYTVTVLDTNGCQTTANFQINDPANNEELDVVALPGNLTHNCFVNGIDGSATLTATGGYAPYTYQVTGPNGYNTTQISNPNFINLLSGTYNVTVSDTNGCSATTTFQINDPANNEELDVVALPGNLTHNCFVNGTDGSATLTATGGYAPYTYQVTGPNSYNTTQIANPTFTNLLSGTYNVTVSDTNGCSAITTFTINDPANNEELAVVALPVDITHNCFVNGPDGSAILIATGGYAPYTYQVTGPNGYNTTQISNPNFINLFSGTYNVTVSDTNGCSTTTTFQINDPANNEELAVVALPGNLIHNCFVNGTDGSATLTATGGYAPYTYQVTGPNGYNTTQVANPTFTNLFSGTYNVTVGDTNGCSATTTFQINDPANNEELAVVALPGNLIHNCFVNGTDGSATLTATGGYAPYTYQVTGPNSYNTTQVANPTFTNLLSGTYNVTVSDTNGCSATTTFQINDPANNEELAVVALPGNLIHNCFVNGTDGSATLTATGGYAPYTYQVTGPNSYNTTQISNPTFTNLLSGTYNVTVSDTNGCSATTTFQINDPANNEELAVVALPGNLIHNCFVNGTDGSATLTATGGYAPYTYQVTGPNSYNTTQIANPTFTNLFSGTYNVTVSDTNGCSATTTFTINDPANNEELAVVALPGNLIHNCFVNGTDGSATLTATGGYAPYTYQVTGPNSYNTTQIANPTFTNLLSGTYNVTVSDTNSCSATTTFQINDPANNEELAVVALPGNLIHNCFVNGTDGSATLTATGGYAPYTYQVTGPNSYNTTQIANPTFTNLLSGTYNVTVSDTNGCSATTTFQINDPANNEELAVVALPGNLIHNCFVNGTDGSATLTATGGYAPYTYQVTGPNSYNTTQISNPTFTNLLSGTYNVTVSDTNGCSATTTFQINDPANNEELAVVALPDNLIHNCFVNGTDGSATLTATGGYAPYTYQVTGPNSYNTTQVSNPTFTNLLSGTYNVTVSDTNGCSATTTFTIVDPANGAVLTATVPSDSLTHNCIVGANTGIVHVAATGGFAPYMYQLASGTPQASNTFTGLAAGNYSVTVTDTNGCTSMVAFTILEPTDNLTLTVQTGSVIHNCVPNASTGSAVLVAAGGYGSYSYVLDAGTAQPQGSFTNLTTGNHTVVVTDLHGCTATQTFYISNPPSQQELTATVNPSDVLHNCIPGGQAGQAAISALYGFPPYTYTLNGGTPQVSSVFTSLASGNYTVIVTDSNGCQKTATFTINDPLNGQELAVNIAPQNIVHICVPGTNTGSVTVTAANGFPSYVYSLNGGANQTSNVFNNLAAGNYTVTVTDQNGCLKTASFIIEQPAIELAAQIFSNNVTHVCVPGQNTGSFEVSAYGGFAPLTYSFNGGAFTSNNIYTNLFAGTYTVTVKDAHNCTKDVTVTITNPPSGHAISAFVNELDINHNCIAGQNNGVVKISASGGYTPYRYVVAGGTPQISNIFTGVATGTHNFTVIDANGCETYVSATVKDNDLPQIYLANADSNGCAPLTLTFDKNEYNYLSCNWLINGDTVNKNCNDMEYTFNTPGCYQVQFVGQGQTRCYGSSNMVTICVTSRPIASFTPSSYEVNSIENVIYFNNTSQNADYYNWSFGDFTPDATTEHVTHTFVGVENQNFTVILTAYTETGCADTAAVRFTMKEEIIFFVPNAFTPDGDNFNNVFKPIITEGVDLTSYNLLIFDRWGEVIFESNDVDYGWDGTYLFNGGKLCQDGTYVWKIRFKKKGMDDIIEKTGHVTLVR